MLSICHVLGTLPGLGAKVVVFGLCPDPPGVWWGIGKDFIRRTGGTTGSGWGDPAQHRKKVQAVGMCL